MTHSDAHQPDGPDQWRPRGEVDLAQSQIEAIDRWNRARRAAEQSAELLARTREARLDLDRLLDVTRREHEAMIARTQEHLRDSARVLRGASARRAVVVHRNEWFKDKVCAVLEEHGIDVVMRLDNGADAVGTCIAEQPDLLLVEDSLPMLSGVQVVRKVRTWSPRTISAAHVGHDERIAALLEAGARTAWTRRVPPADVGLALVRLIEADGEVQDQLPEQPNVRRGRPVRS